jgi:disulfide oxidoreductase YuzD
MVASNYVHTTTDYFLFKPIEGNRTQNKLHLQRLKKSMKENYLFTIIVVNEKYEIIDGHHRFTIIKELGLPLNYIVCEGYGLGEVHIFNQNSKTWTAQDYLSGYCDLGYRHYIEYRKFQQKYQFGHNECMAVLSNNKKTGGSLFTQFKDGKFKIANISDADAKAKKIWLFADLYQGFLRRSFVYAMLDLFEKPQFDFAEFLQKVKNQPSVLTDCSTAAQYITLIEEIYNYRRREKVNLRY